MSKILDIFIDWSWALLCVVWAIECIFLWRTLLRKKLFGKKNARVLLTELTAYREDYLSRPVDLDKEVYLGRPGLVFWPLDGTNRMDVMLESAPGLRLTYRRLIAE